MWGIIKLKETTWRQRRVRRFNKPQRGRRDLDRREQDTGRRETLTDEFRNKRRWRNVPPSYSHKQSSPSDGRPHTFTDTRGAGSRAPIVVLDRKDFREHTETEQPSREQTRPPRTRTRLLLAFSNTIINNTPPGSALHNHRAAFKASIQGQISEY